ncbi:uracil-xanthine permease family protein [Methanorbis rubei]|uniref:Purine permease YwdJ n=1 Tax=Methanorbis rubei TaxID=3028300 RepID=A0AAE4MFG8_9EURY|nr:putative purine permease YwdJ [Methanocorpusculaceae archaeon Cs1]
MLFRYQIDDRVPLKELITSGIMWSICSSIFVIIVASVVGNLYGFTLADTIWYTQKMLIISGVAVILQVLFGHKLPVVFGPSVIFLTAVAASADFSVDVLATSIILCSVAGIIIARTRVLEFVARLFTVRVIATVLMLLSITLVPTFVRLLVNMDQPGGTAAKLVFAFVLLVCIIALNHRLKGFWRATLMLWMLVVGTVAALFCFPGTTIPFVDVSEQTQAFSGLFITPGFAPGVFLSVFICYLAVMVNDIGSIKSVVEVTGADQAQTEPRLRRALSITGMMNIISGAFGLIGGVNYSISSGMVLDTKNASRYPLIAGGVLMIVCACIPTLILLIDSIPTVVTGCLLIFIMTSQLAAAFGVLAGRDDAPPMTFNGGVIIGFSLLIAATVAFLPAELVDTIPAVLRPVVANGFVAGTVAVMILEHVIFRKSDDEILKRE